MATTMASRHRSVAAPWSLAESRTAAGPMRSVSATACAGPYARSSRSAAIAAVLSANARLLEASAAGVRVAKAAAIAAAVAVSAATARAAVTLADLEAAEAALEPQEGGGGVSSRSRRPVCARCRQSFYTVAGLRVHVAVRHAAADNNFGRLPRWRDGHDDASLFAAYVTTGRPAAAAMTPAPAVRPARPAPLRHHEDTVPGGRGAAERKISFSSWFRLHGF